MFAGIIAIAAASNAAWLDSPSAFRVDGLVADEMSEPEDGGDNFFQADIMKPPAPRMRSGGILAAPPPMPAPSGQSQGSGRTYQHVQAAEDYVSSKEWNRAFYEIQQALAYDQGNLALLKKAAAYASLARKFSAADEYFRQVIEQQPDNVHFLAAHSGVLVRLLRLKEAEETAERALRLDSNNMVALFNKLCIKIARDEGGYDTGAWTALSTSELLQLINWLDADGVDYRTALTDAGFSKLCETVLGPDTETRLAELSEILNQASGAMRQGKWDEAIERFDEAKRLGIASIGLDMEIIRCLFEKGEQALALQRSEKLAADYPLRTVLYDQGYILLNLERYEEAEVVLNKALLVAPDEPQILMALACAYSGQNVTDKAWPILTRLAASHPASLREWTRGRVPYLRAIQNDPRFKDLMATIDNKANP